jgi:hypothetical protein
MSKEKKQNPHTVRKKLVGLPDSAWAGAPGDKFEAGLQRIFDTPLQESDSIADSRDLEMSASAVNSRIELGITEFAKTEEVKTRLALERRRLEAEVRSKELDNALKEVALLTAMKNAGINGYFKDGLLKLQAYSSQPKASQTESPAKELTSRAEDSKD